MQNSGIDAPNGWVLKNHVFDNGYYAELVGGKDPGVDSIETLGNSAPPWVRLFQPSNGNGFPDRRVWRGTPSGVDIVMVCVVPIGPFVCVLWLVGPAALNFYF